MKERRLADGLQMLLTVVCTIVAFAVVCAFAWLLVPGGGGPR